MGQDLKARAMAEPVAQQQKAMTLPQKIERMQREFEMAQPKGMEAVQLIRDAQTCVRMTPKLAECEHASVLGSLMTCAQLGLRPGVLGQAYLLPLWNSRNRRFEAQLIIGYQGLLELIYRSDRIAMVQARVVHENDEFALEYGLEQDTLIHRPPVTGPRGRAVKYYAIARFKGGGYAITEPRTREDMEQFRDKYAMAKKKDGTIVGPWVTQFDEMAKKTMLRELAKTLPKSPEVQRAITHDGAVRQDYSAGGIDARPDYIDGSVEPDVQAVETQGADEPQPADEPPAPVDRDSLEAALQAAFADQAMLDPKEQLEWLANLVTDKVEAIKDLTDAEIENAIAVLSGNSK